MIKWDRLEWSSFPLQKRWRRLMKDHTFHGHRTRTLLTWGCGFSKETFSFSARIKDLTQLQILWSSENHFSPLWFSFRLWLMFPKQREIAKAWAFTLSARCLEQRSGVSSLRFSKVHSGYWVENRLSREAVIVVQVRPSNKLAVEVARGSQIPEMTFF